MLFLYHTRKYGKSIERQMRKRLAHLRTDFVVFDLDKGIRADEAHKK